MSLCSSFFNLILVYTDFLVEDIMVVFLDNVCVVGFGYFSSSIGIFKLFQNRFPVVSLEPFNNSKMISQVLLGVWSKSALVHLRAYSCIQFLLAFLTELHRSPDFQVILRFHIQSY